MHAPRFLGLVLVCLCFSASAALAQPSDPEALAVQAVVRSFHEALHRGDVEAIRQLLAGDAVILESGRLESRQEYLRHHVDADIEFAKAVASKVTTSEATISGQTAWVRSTSVSQGTFRNRVLKLVGAELVVLTRAAARWEIRAIHWSSHESK